MRLFSALRGYRPLYKATVSLVGCVTIASCAGCSAASNMAANVFGDGATTTRTSTVVETASADANSSKNASASTNDDSAQGSTSSSDAREPHTPSESRTGSSESASEAEQRVYNELKSQVYGLKVGSHIHLDGMNLEVCVYGDGLGISITAVDANKGNTSCEFAANVAHALIDGVSFDDGLRATLPRTVSVSSPVTEHKYDMRCINEPTKIIRCTGGNDALVVLR